MINLADIIAIRRAFVVGGRDRALGELRRRYLALNDKTAPMVLDRLLRLPVAMPPVFRQDDMRHKPTLVRT